MEKIKVLIVEDEPIARDIMAAYVAKIDHLQLIGQCKNALEAFSLLASHEADLILLDINLPEISGLHFLKTIRNPPCVIFTTAYAEFAVESYEHNAVDYLLKPIAFERFLKAIDKATDVIQQKNNAGNPDPQPPALITQGTGPEPVFVKSEGKLIKIDLSELLLVEGLKDYVRLWTANGKIIVHSTLKNIEEQLEKQPFFIRVNKSYIVNLKFVSAVEGNTLYVSDHQVPIGNTYREAVQQLLQGYRLL